MQSTILAPDISVVGKQAYNGIIPRDVDIMYFHEGKRIFVVAVKIDTVRIRFTLGYSVFRRDTPADRFNKKALRETAVKRLFMKPIIVATPSMEVVQRVGEDAASYEQRKTKVLSKRRAAWMSFSAAAEGQLKTGTTIAQRNKINDTRRKLIREAIASHPYATKSAAGKVAATLSFQAAAVDAIGESGDAFVEFVRGGGVTKSLPIYDLDSLSLSTSSSDKSGSWRHRAVS